MNEHSNRLVSDENFWFIWKHSRLSVELYRHWLLHNSSSFGNTMNRHLVFVVGVVCGVARFRSWKINFSAHPTTCACLKNKNTSTRFLQSFFSRTSMHAVAPIRRVFVVVCRWGWGEPTCEIIDYARAILAKFVAAGGRARKVVKLVWYARERKKTRKNRRKTSAIWRKHEKAFASCTAIYTRYNRGIRPGGKKNRTACVRVRAVRIMAIELFY